MNNNLAIFWNYGYNLTYNYAFGGTFNGTGTAGKGQYP